MIPADDGRYELKFVAPETRYHELLAWLHMRPQAFRRAYPSRRINSVYFDGGRYELYIESAEGASARTKVRYRWYGEAPNPDAGRLEVKVRRNRLGWKLRFDVSCLDGGEDRWDRIRARIVGAVPTEAGIWLQVYNRPFIVNRYQREYWVSGDGTIRVTFDRDHAVFDQRYGSLVNSSRRAYLDPRVVMEVKCSRHLSGEASRLVASLPLPLSRHSKYCEAIEAVAGF